MTWGVIDVRECGAAGDGHADDTEPILKAVDQLPEAGGVLYFPPGVISHFPSIVRLKGISCILSN